MLNDPLAFSQAESPWSALSLDFRGKSGGAKVRWFPFMSFFPAQVLEVQTWDGSISCWQNRQSGQRAKQKSLDGIGATWCNGMGIPYSLSTSFRSPLFLRPAFNQGEGTATHDTVRCGNLQGKPMRSSEMTRTLLQRIWDCRREHTWFASRDKAPCKS